MKTKDSIGEEVLGGLIGAAEVKWLAKEIRANRLFENLFDIDDRVARNSAWVLTHKPISEIRELPQSKLIDLAISTPNPSLRRLVLNLIEQQPMAKEDIRTDFLDFCLQRMTMLEEAPGVQSLCMKLAYRMCKYYPELTNEFEAALSLIPSEQYKPGVRYLIKKLKTQLS